MGAASNGKASGLPTNVRTIRQETGETNRGCRRHGREQEGTITSSTTILDHPERASYRTEGDIQPIAERVKQTGNFRGIHTHREESSPLQQRMGSRSRAVMARERTSSSSDNVDIQPVIEAGETNRGGQGHVHQREGIITSSDEGIRRPYRDGTQREGIIIFRLNGYTTCHRSE